jgi:hypothetical protein
MDEDDAVTPRGQDEDAVACVWFFLPLPALRHEAWCRVLLTLA